MHLVIFRRWEAIWQPRLCLTCVGLWFFLLPFHFQLPASCLRAVSLVTSALKGQVESRINTLFHLTFKLEEELTAEFHHVGEKGIILYVKSWYRTSLFSQNSIACSLRDFWCLFAGSALWVESLSGHFKTGSPDFRAGWKCQRTTKSRLPSPSLEESRAKCSEKKKKKHFVSSTLVFWVFCS